MLARSSGFCQRGTVGSKSCVLPGCLVQNVPGRSSLGLSSESADAFPEVSVTPTAVLCRARSVMGGPASSHSLLRFHFFKRFKFRAVSWSRRLLPAVTVSRKSCGKAGGPVRVPGYASLGREGDLLRPSAARTCAHTHTTFYKRRSNTNAQALRSTQKHRRRRARGTVYWLVQGFVSKPRKSSSAFSSKWPSQEPHTTFLCQFGWVERLSLEKFSCAKIRRLSP